MSIRSNLRLLFLMCSVWPFSNADHKVPTLTWGDGYGKLEIGFNTKNESFYGDHTSYLSRSYLDQILYFQTTSDLTAYAVQGDVLRCRLMMRNKFRAGDPTSLGKTSDSTFKIADAGEEGKHNHFVGKPILWLREAWFEAYLNSIFDIRTDSKHFFKLGLFPFQLGRGIALGDAYAVSPGALGFYSNNVIDQYAYGALLHGSLGSNNLEYDFYFSILQNLSGSFADVTSKIYSNEIGMRKTPWRGFGHVNFVFGTRLIGVIKGVGECCGDVRLEPYAFVNYDPEETVEFPSDASAKLATVGIAVDYIGSKFEWGFETAANFGHQNVKAWDGNYIKMVNRSGNAVFEYTRLWDGDPTNPASRKALVTSSAKAAAAAGGAGEAFNGLEVGDTGFYNGLDRFNNAYTNEYKGVMFVADCSYKPYDGLKLSAEFDFASGDENPNKDLLGIGDSLIDGDYMGFIPFQSNYSGRKVASAFFLGLGRVARPLSVAPTLNPRDSVATTDSGFTNLILAGFGADIQGNIKNKRSRFRPNIIFGWQDYATRDFDFVLKKATDKRADRYLGFEINLFSEVEIYKNLKLFLVSGFFVPGAHFQDIKGKPLNVDQVEALSNPVDGCGGVFGPNAYPLISTETAFLLNLGINFAF